ncbi:MAG: acylphosphatase [Frankiaceae bacterium]|nr:acylphosphatase [Frankiaceae bacterium]MBV9869396.1 acylphosphatase [Frankiaceae bacterium]
MSDSPDRPNVRLSAWIRGRVQGVGMRWWIRARALDLGLTGWARNLDDGRVEVIAEGPEASCQALLALLNQAAPPGRPGRIDTVVDRWGAAGGLGDLGGADFVER